MVFNSGGKKTKGKARKNFRKPKVFNSEELKKISGQEYAFVTKKLGDNRYTLICYDKVSRMGILRGSLKRGPKLDINQMVLVSIRDFQDDKCDIIAIYSTEEVDKLIAFNEILPSFAKEGKICSSVPLEESIIQIGDDTDSDDISLNSKNNDDDDEIEGIDIDDL